MNYTRKYKKTFIEIIDDLEILTDLELSDKKSILDFKKKLLELSSQLASKSFYEFFGDFIENI